MLNINQIISTLQKSRSDTYKNKLSKIWFSNWEDFLKWLSNQITTNKINTCSWLCCWWEIKKIVRHIEIDNKITFIDILDYDLQNNSYDTEIVLFNINKYFYWHFKNYKNQLLEKYSDLKELNNK